MNKNIEHLKSFTEYCNKYPEQRFWQALRNWAAEQYPDKDINFIFSADLSRTYLEDTFNWE